MYKNGKIMGTQGSETERTRANGSFKIREDNFEQDAKMDRS